MFSKKEYGLVFSGGGGKGAYQIGVWKALNELRITPNVKAVSGASVGSLNALLFSQTTYDHAVSTWLDVDQNDMLFTTDETKRKIINSEFSCIFEQGNFADKSSLIKPFITLSLIIPPFIPMLSLLSPIIKLFCKECTFNFESIKKLADLIQYSILKGGAFSQDRLSKIIDEVLFISDNVSKITSFATVCKAGDLETFLKKTNIEYINLVNKTPVQAREIVLASAALPFIYPKRRIDNYEYYDGGWADNTPIKPLYDIGLKDIIVVYLENNKHNKLKKCFREENEKFPDVNFIRIIPNNKFKDDFIQTISVSKELTQERINAGYYDGIQQLKNNI